jgi:hypothetical protein
MTDIYTPYAPFRVNVTPVTYTPYAQFLVRVSARYTPYAPFKVRVLSPVARPPYAPFAPFRVNVNHPAANPLTYRPYAPFRISVNDPVTYFRVYRPFAPFKVNVNGTYTPFAPFLVKVRGDTVRQGSLLTTATPAFWVLKVCVNGVNLTPRVTGEVSIEASENTATTASFSLLPHAERIDPTIYVGQPVTIDYEGHRRFTGAVDTLDVDLSTSVIRFLCTDGLQMVFERIAGGNARAVADAKIRLIAAENGRNKTLHDISLTPGLTQQQINARVAAAEAKVAKAAADVVLAERRTGMEVRKVVGGLWSPHVFSSSSGWDAFADCMSTQLAAYNLDSFGAGATTPWAAKAAPDFTFTADDCLDGELRVNQLANAGSVVNAVDIKFEYRFTRLFEYAFSLGWAPGDSYSWCAAFGPVSNWGNCDHKRVAEAISGAGFCIRADRGTDGYSLSISPNNGLCMAPIPGPGWVTLPNAASSEVLFLSDVPRFSSVGAFTANVVKRYKQVRSDTVIHTVTAPQSIARVGRVGRVVGHAVESGPPTNAELARIVEGWEETVTDTLSYPVSKNGVSAMGAAYLRGEFAGSAVESVPLSLPRYKMARPSQPPDNTVKPTIAASVTNWDITRDPVDGRLAQQDAYACVKAVALNTIVGSHRQNEVSATLFPAHKTVELSHTVQFERESPYFRAKGKVSSLSHAYNIETGEATTELTVSLVKPWATGVHYVDPYIPLPDTGTIVYPGSLFNPALSTWPDHDYNLLGRGNPSELAEEPPETTRFMGYNYFTGALTLESPPTPQEAAPSFSSVTRTGETLTLPDDLFLMDG